MGSVETLLVCWPVAVFASVNSLQLCRGQQLALLWQMTDGTVKHRTIQSRLCTTGAHKEPNDDFCHAQKKNHVQFQIRRSRMNE